MCTFSFIHGRSVDPSTTSRYFGAETKISGSDNEEDSDSEEEEGSETIPEDFSIGNWVVVNYNGEEFPGEITSCGSEIEVSVMHKSGNKFWKWPKTIDKIFYERKNVVRKINPPKVAGHRGHED